MESDKQMVNKMKKPIGFTESSSKKFLKKAVKK